jgi:hypothetical protein
MDKNNALCLKTYRVEGPGSVATKDSEVDDDRKAGIYIAGICVWTLFSVKYELGLKERFVT